MGIGRLQRRQRILRLLAIELGGCADGWQPVSVQNRIYPVFLVKSGC